VPTARDVLSAQGKNQKMHGITVVKNQITRLQAHTDHLLNCLLGLKEKYAFLHPMLFDQEVVKVYGNGERYRGFESVKFALFYACAQDLARLALDTDKRTPSIVGIISPLKTDPELLEELCIRYSTWGYVVPETVDSDVRVALEQNIVNETEERRKTFYGMYNALNLSWDAFNNKSSTNAFKTIRDKLTAHLELHLSADGVYLTTDISTLGLKWRDLEDGINDAEIIVKLLNDIVRSANFAMENFNEELKKAVCGFWGNSDRFKKHSMKPDTQ
jgi:hypothetical protein